MPGFNIEGAWAEGPNAVSEVRRKHRWLFTIAGIPDQQRNRATLYLQKAARPSVKFEPVEMHHDQEKAYFAGKTEWEAITLEFYDAEQDPDVSQWVWDWACGPQGVVNITAVTVAVPSSYKKKSQLEMRDGAGATTETWTLWNSWPTETNWNELDYTISDIAMVTVVIRYDRAKRE